jgi:hypothetical protein
MPEGLTLTTISAERVAKGGFDGFLRCLFSRLLLLFVFFVLVLGFGFEQL